MRLCHRRQQNAADRGLRCLPLHAESRCSEHNCGLAADLNSPEHTGLDEGFEKTAAFRWLCEHAGDYGFILRYPKDAEDKTEIIYEPWHWRYVGVENAAKINASGLCFEEYIETLQSIAAEG